MASAHFGHDVVVGNNCIFANGALIGGHVTIEDRAFVSGAVAVHQFCRIGRLVMAGGHARVIQDIPPYMLLDGHSGCVVGLNIVGLRRSGHTAEDIADLKAAYRVIYRRGLPWKEVLEALRMEFSSEPVAHLRTFLSGGTRGFAQERARHPLRRFVCGFPTKKRHPSGRRRAENNSSLRKTPTDKPLFGENRPALYRAAGSGVEASASNPLQPSRPCRCSLRRSTDRSIPSIRAASDLLFIASARVFCRWARSTSASVIQDEPTPPLSIAISDGAADRLGSTR